MRLLERQTERETEREREVVYQDPVSFSMFQLFQQVGFFIAQLGILQEEQIAKVSKLVSGADLFKQIHYWFQTVKHI